MVSLRSGRQDRTLMIMVWLLTVVVLGLGIATVNPILLLWGVLGLPAAVFLTRIHLRDTRPASSPDDRLDQPAEPAGLAAEPADRADRANLADVADVADRSDQADQPGRPGRPDQ